jgi:hypothetical protein
MVSTRKNNITGAASVWAHAAPASAKTYRKSDSKCDFPDHTTWVCLCCPLDRCLHDVMGEYSTPRMDAILCEY